MSKLNRNEFLHCLVINARSLKNKLAELHELMYRGDDSYDIICITESWLNHTVSDAMLDPHNEFTVYRCDRNSVKIGGGVCVFIKRQLRVVKIDLPECFKLLECVCFDVFIQNDTIRVFNIYRSPGGCASTDKIIMQTLIDCFNRYCTTDVTSLILGDLNCKNINWSELTATNDFLQKKLFLTQ